MNLTLNPTEAQSKSAKKNAKKKRNKNKKPLTVQGAEPINTQSVDVNKENAKKAKLAQKRKERKAKQKLLKQQAKKTLVVDTPTKESDDAKKRKLDLTEENQTESESTKKQQKIEKNENNLPARVESEANNASTLNAASKKEKTAKKVCLLDQLLNNKIVNRLIFSKNVPFRRVNEEEVDKNLLEKMGKNSFIHKVSFCFN
jgi:hypothetical protein